jgi:hypothetical protein
MQILVNVWLKYSDLFSFIVYNLFDPLFLTHEHEQGQGSWLNLLVVLRINILFLPFFIFASLFSPGLTSRE